MLYPVCKGKNWVRLYQLHKFTKILTNRSNLSFFRSAEIKISYEFSTTQSWAQNPKPWPSKSKRTPGEILESHRLLGKLMPNTMRNLSNYSRLIKGNIRKPNYLPGICFTVIFSCNYIFKQFTSSDSVRKSKVGRITEVKMCILN